MRDQARSLLRLPWSASAASPARNRDDKPRERAEDAADGGELALLRRTVSLHRVVSQALADAATIDDAADKAVRALGECLGWECAIFWLVDEPSDTLRCRATWQAPASAARAIEAAIRRARPRPGAGLAGRAWRAGVTLHETDPQPERSAAYLRSVLDAGLRDGTAVPVRVGQRSLAVVEGFARATDQPDEAWLQTITAVGSQLGHILLRIKAEQDRSANEMHLDAILEAAIDGVIRMDRSGRIIGFNAAAETMFGYRRAVVKGRSLAECIIPARLRQQHLDGLACYLTTGKERILRRRIETVGMRADGSEFPIELAITKTIVDGAPLFTAYVRDITERRQMEAELCQSRQEAVDHSRQLEATIEAMVDGMTVYGPDGQMIITNTADNALIGLDARPDYYGLPIAERMALLDPRDERGRPIAPDEWPQFRILRGDVLTGTHSSDVQIRNLRGDDMVIDVSGAPIRDESGTIAGAVVICRDVTEQRMQKKRTHQALQALLAMAEALAHSATPGQAADAPARDPFERSAQTTTAIALRLATLIRTVLGCQVVVMGAIMPDSTKLQPLAAIGLSPEDEERWWTTFPGSTLREYGTETEIDRFRVGDQFELAELPVPTQGDLGRFLCVPIRLDDRLIGFMGVNQREVAPAYSADELALIQATARLAAIVIERERLQSEWEVARENELALREANQQMDQLLSLASHEIRTPLTHFKGGVQLALRRLDRAIAQASDTHTPLDAIQLQPVRDLLVQTDRQTNRLIRLVNDLLDVSRIRVESLEIRPARCDLVAIVRDVVLAQQSIKPERAITLDLPDSSGAPIEADAERIGQVVQNFLTNALKFAPEERPIEVRLTLAGDRALVAVRDEGPGVPLDQQERVWERFYRVKGTRVTSGSDVGLGLGLYLAKTLVERHHGSVGLRSAAGEGCTFWFALPLAAGERE